jgi:pSer/pThr/pTyr-binding forkhead associated (FHA) protein
VVSLRNMESGLTGPHAATAAELKDRMAAERRGQPFLIMRDGTATQVLVELPITGPPTRTIGRAEECDIALPWDGQVSRVHAELVWVGRDWAVDDGGLSRNGTYVNGQRIAERRRLRDGDTLRFGETAMVFRRPSDAIEIASATVTASSLPGPGNLSDSQRAVLRELCRPLAADDGRSTPATNPEIAKALFLSLDAIKGHMRVLFGKFGVDGLPQNQKRVRLAERALETGAVLTAELREDQP